MVEENFAASPVSYLVILHEDQIAPESSMAIKYAIGTRTVFYEELFFDP